MKKLSDWGIIGLGIIGSNLAMNFSKKGFKLSVYNRSIKGLEENVAKNFVKKNNNLKHINPFDNISYFVKSIEKPRKILILIFTEHSLKKNKKVGLQKYVLHVTKQED